jgi:(2R)-ethylmalonyl-CoA mutase
VAKPGLDGHSNGAEQIAVAARDEDVDVIGLSILSGSHLALVARVVEELRARDLDIKVVVGGIVPPDDAASLLNQGVVAIYTPKDFSLGAIMDDLLGIVESLSPVGVDD